MDEELNPLLAALDTYIDHAESTGNFNPVADFGVSVEEFAEYADVVLSARGSEAEGKPWTQSDLLALISVGVGTGMKLADNRNKEKLDAVFAPMEQAMRNETKGETDGN